MSITSEVQRKPTLRAALTVPFPQTREVKMMIVVDDP